MDVNGTRLFLRLGREDWTPLLDGAAGLEWDAGFSGARLQALPYEIAASGRQETLGPSDRRGADRDAFGTWYWIDGDARGLRYWPAGQGEPGSFWDGSELTLQVCSARATGDFHACPPPVLQEPPQLRGLAVTTRHYLLVGTLNPAGLLVFDLHGGGVPVWQRWPEELEPFDIRADLDGGAWVLDTGISGPGLWHLDVGFRPIGEGGLQTPRPEPVDDLFQPTDSGPRRTRIDSDRPLPIPLFDIAWYPVAVERLSGRSVLVLDNPPGEGFSRVLLVRGLAHAAVSLEGLLEGGDIRAHDLAFVPDRIQDKTRSRLTAPGLEDTGRLGGTLFLVTTGGDQSFAFRLDALLRSDRPPELTLELLRDRHYPMRRFGGRALVGCDGGVYYDISERWVGLAIQPRPLYEREGVSVPLRLDSGIPDCLWHRVMLDACVPNASTVSLEVRSADDMDLLPLGAWQPQPAFYLRGDGSELPWHLPFGDQAPDRDDQGTLETLLQQVRGRYMELRLRLRGTGRNTPRVRALRVHAPRFSYSTRYLPAVYREDPESASFLGRWLANPEGLLTAIEDRIASGQVLLDARTAPDKYLDWLAGWIGAMYESDWDEARRRLFLAHAATLFRWRGTPSGLRASIRVDIDACPDASIFQELGRSMRMDPVAGYQVRIIEGYEERRLPGVVLGDATAGPLTSASHPNEPWQPSRGAASLHRQFREYLTLGYGDGKEPPGVDLSALNGSWSTSYSNSAEVLFPPLLPTHPGQAADWRDFTGRVLAVPYAEVTTEDEPAWRRFLAVRYRDVDSMSAAHLRPESQRVASFDSVTLPQQLPSVAAELADWIDFVSLRLPIQRQANRFTVLVPAEPREPKEVRDARLSRVTALVERERPAQTGFAVKLYWALFRVGTARLGLDTVLGEGSRYTAIVLGAGHLGEGFVDASHPWNVRDRRVVGRDPITITRSAEA